MTSAKAHWNGRSISPEAGQNRKTRDRGVRMDGRDFASSPWEPALSQVCTVRRIVRADGNPVSGRPVLSDITDLADLAAARGAATSLRYCLFFLLPLARYSGVFYQLL